MKTLKDSVLDKRRNVYRAHNDYVYRLREYHLMDEKYRQNLRQLLDHHEEVQLILNRSWFVSSMDFFTASLSRVMLQ